MSDEVRRLSADAARLGGSWALIDDLAGGTDGMRAAGQRRLPQWPLESGKDYAARLATAVLFPAYRRTVSVLTGKPFSRPVTIGTDVPPQVAEWLEDADLQGRNLHVFASELFEEALGYGLAGILVDSPRSDGLRTVADEKAAGIRPYLVLIRHGALLGWITEQIGGKARLAQLRLLEHVTERDGAFGSKVVEQVRVLEPGRWQTWRALPDKPSEWALFEEGPTSLDVVPFVPVYGKRLDFMAAEPPMLELGHLNVLHWQSDSDQQTILHTARVPLLFARNIPAGNLAAGAGAVIQSNSADADVRYVEHTGAAIDAGRVSLLDLEDRMRQVGAELLVIKPGHTTVAQTLSDNEVGRCDLQRITEAAEDGLDQALDMMARMGGVGASGGHVTIFKDFGANTLAEASATLLAGMRSSGHLSERTLLLEMKRRGILSPDVDVEQEIAAAKADAPAIVQVTDQVRD